MDPQNSIMANLLMTSYDCRGVMSAVKYIDRLLSTCDILCLQEHHLTKESRNFLKTVHKNFNADTVIDADCFTSTVRIRKGGVATLWRKNIDYAITKLDIPTHCDRFIGICVNYPNQLPIFIINVYFPASSCDISMYIDCLNMLQIIVDQYSSQGVVIVAGDINGQLGPAPMRRPGTCQNERGKYFNDFLFYNQMFSTVSDISCKGPLFTYYPDYILNKPSQIDHFVLNLEYVDVVKACYVHDENVINLSDHVPISMSLNININRYECNSRAVYDWNRCDINQYKVLLDSNLTGADTINCLEPKQDINDRLTNIQNSIVKTMTKCVPVYKSCPYKRPYWDSELANAHRGQKLKRYIWVMEGRPRGWNYKCYAEYKNSKKIFAKLLIRKQKEYEQKKYEKLEQNYDIDSRKLWKYVRANKSSQSGFHSLKVENVLYNTPDQLRSYWKSHFCNLLNEQNGESQLYRSDHKSQIDQHILYLVNNYNIKDDDSGTLSLPVTCVEVRNVCQKFSNGKAAGYDNIPYEALKYGTNILYSLLADLFNLIIEFVYVPDDLKKSVIIPLYKGHKKSRCDPNSYRGISLMSAINKLMEKIILNRLQPYFKKVGFPPPLQNCCRKGCSSITTSYLVQEVINYHCERNGKVYGCFLDIQKAFDTVWWSGLLYKLSEIGIKNKLWWIFRNWLLGSKCTVLINGEFSEFFTITRSIKQGGLLSMLLFTVAFYDFHDFVNSRNDGLKFHDIDIGSPTYADDSLLLSNTRTGLQNMINLAFEYGRRWRFVFSSSKTKCITFGETKYQNRNNRSKRTWWLGNVIVQEIDHFVYLGTKLCAYGQTKERTKDMCNKGYACLGSLCSVGINKNGLSPRTCSSLWSRASIPAFLYGCETWGKISKQEYSDLEKVNKTF